jgi:D-psicose/D-tagatose/L-ribulose 3-epimerase
MKFACSSIAFAPGEVEASFDLLAAEGITGIELAPTTVWPGWQGATPQAARELAQRWQDRGFAIPALQAVTFDCDAGELFGASERVARLEQHLAVVAEIASAAGAGVVVFGAPRVRRRGELTIAEAIERAAPVLRRIARTFSDHGVALALEPVPPVYNCDFINTTDDAIRMVEFVGAPGLAVNLDAAALWLAGERPSDYLPAAADWLRHYHISEPELGDFVAPHAPHAEWLVELRSLGWKRWCSIEMRRPKGDLAHVGPWQAIRAARRANGPERFVHPLGHSAS